MSSFYGDIRFENHILREIRFSANPTSESDGALDFDPKLSIDEESRKAILGLDFKVFQNGSSVEGELLGIFSYNENLKKEALESLLFANGVAILFPYLRAAVGNISMLANVDPIVIPTINVLEYMKDRFGDDETT